MAGRFVHELWGVPPFENCRVLLPMPTGKGHGMAEFSWAGRALRPFLGGGMDLIC